jgi:hypothetical protein
MDFLTDTHIGLHIPWIAIDDKRIHYPDSSPAYITDHKIGLTQKDADNIILIGKCMRFTQQSLLDRINRNG